MLIRLVAFAIAVLLAAPAPASAQHEHGATPPQVDVHASFRADAPLSREMAKIRVAFATHISAIEAGRLDAAGYAVLGGEVQTRVNTIIRECRLPAEADAVLHGYIGRMLTDAARMRQADLDLTARRAAALDVVKIYNEYGRRFVDPAWKSLAP